MFKDIIADDNFIAADYNEEMENLLVEAEFERLLYQEGEFNPTEEFWGWVEEEILIRG